MPTSAEIGDGLRHLAIEAMNVAMAWHVVAIGALVAINFDGYIVVINNAGHLRVFVGFAIHHVAPVAPDCADVEEDGLVFGLGSREGVAAPRVPLDRLMAR